MLVNTHLLHPCLCIVCSLIEMRAHTKTLDESLPQLYVTGQEIESKFMFKFFLVYKKADFVGNSKTFLKLIAPAVARATDELTLSAATIINLPLALRGTPVQKPFAPSLVAFAVPFLSLTVLVVGTQVIVVVEGTVAVHTHPSCRFLSHDSPLVLLPSQQQRPHSSIGFALD